MGNLVQWMVRLFNLALLIAMIYMIWLGISNRDVRIIIPAVMILLVSIGVGYADVVDTIRRR